MTPDPWEAIWLTPNIGLADQLNIDPTILPPIGKRLFEKYSVNTASEKDYWAEFGNELNIVISQEVVREIEAHVMTHNPYLHDFLAQMKAQGIHLGIISNNTDFWFAKQLDTTTIAKYFDPDLIFLSHVTGISKQKAHPNLFDTA